MDDLWHALFRYIHRDSSIGWCFVYFVDTAEPGDLATASLRIEAPPVRRLAVLKRSCNMDQEEVRSSTTILEDNFASNLTTSLVGSDRGGNNSGTSSRQFGGNESNSL